MSGSDSKLYDDNDVGGIKRIRAMVAESRKNSPQLLLSEVLAWLKAGSSDEMIANAVNDIFLTKTLSRSYVTSISRAEKAFSVPVYQNIRNNDSDTIGSKIARFFGYVWLDATATAGLVGALYTTSMFNDGEEHSRFNALYPILVGIGGVMLKTLLVALAIASLPIMLIPAAVALVAYAAGFSKAASTIMAPVNAVIGLIATVPLSNINPVIAFKTLLYDPYKCIQRINKINADVKTGKTLKRELATRELNVTDGVTNLADIHKENAPEIDAQFKIEGGLRTDAVTKATNKMFSSAYVIKPRLSAWDPRNFARKEFVLEIRNTDNKKLIGTIHTKISGSNNLKLQFTKEADGYIQDILAVGFTKMIQEISHMANSKEPIKLDISNSAVREGLIVNTVDALNNTGMKAKLELIDRNSEITTDPRISDEIEDQKPAVNDKDETHNDGDIEVDADDERSKSSRSRRDALRGDSGFFRDHNKL